MARSLALALTPSGLLFWWFQERNRLPRFGRCVLSKQLVRRGTWEKKFGRDRYPAPCVRARVCVPSLVALRSQSVWHRLHDRAWCHRPRQCNQPHLLVAKGAESLGSTGVEVWKLGVCHFHTRPKSEVLCINTRVT